MALAASGAADVQVELRYGDWRTSRHHNGQDTQPTVALSKYRANGWVSAACSRLDRSSQMLQARLLPHGREATSSVFSGAMQSWSNAAPCALPNLAVAKHMETTVASRRQSYVSPVLPELDLRRPGTGLTAVSVIY